MLVSTEFIIIVAIVVILFVVLFFWLARRLPTKISSSADPALLQWLTSIQQSLENTQRQVLQTLNTHNQQVNQNLSHSSQMVSQRLDAASQLVAAVSKELGGLQEVGKAMKDLQLLLQSPKLRGNLGEEILSDMLTQVFPKGSFHLQHRFKTGEQVDAALTTAAGTLPIDAKFPMSNFEKLLKADDEKERQNHEHQFSLDVKKHIKAIATKYIVPDEGTVDFALMYIPSEAVFNEVSKVPELLVYAREHRIYPVSPNTLYVHLQTILLSLEGQRMESQSKQVLRILRMVQKDFGKFEESFQTLGRHLAHASGQFTQASQQATVLGQKLRSQELLEE